jgi:DNA primase
MDSAVEQIKAKLNITDIVGQYVQLRRAGRTYMARCPFHKERTPSFHVSAERGTYKCFGCGEGGDIFTFVEKMDGVDFRTALKQLADRAGVKLEQYKERPPEEKEKEERLREVCEAAVQFFELELKRRKDVQDYIKTRGVHADISVAWRLGYAPAAWDELSRHLQKVGFTKQEIIDAGFGVESQRRQGEVFDRFRGRIMFPIFDMAGQPIAVSGRYFEKVPGSTQEGEPAKYVNSPETLIFKKSRTLYGLDRARGFIRKADCILLVEGQFDLLMSHQSGLPFAVALSGTALTDEHLAILGRISKRLVLALDADDAGIRAGLKSAQMALQAGFDVKVPSFPQGADPADVAKENPELLKAAVRTSATAVEFFLAHLRQGTRDERAYKKTVESHILPLVRVMQSKIDQEHFMAIIARVLSVSPEAVKSEVAKVKISASATPTETLSPEIHQKTTELELTPLQKKVGMLVSRFGADSEIAKQLRELLGDRMESLMGGLETRAEELRFRFDSEVGEHTTEQAVAGDMLADIKQQVERERLRMKFV